MSADKGDLVERLRREAFRDDDVLIDTMSIIFESADTIFSLRAQLASARKALEEIAKEVFTDGTPTKAARTAQAALKEISQ